MENTGKIGIVAFAFGLPARIRSNEHIARITLQKAQELQAPIYTQFHTFYLKPLEFDVTYTQEKPGQPPPTLRIARGAVEWASEKGLKELWIAAAKPHMWRCLRDLEYAAKEAGLEIKIKVCEEIEQIPEEEWFCPDSGQEWTRSPESWRKRERILERLPMWLYKLAVS